MKALQNLKLRGNAKRLDNSELKEILDAQSKHILGGYTYSVSCCCDIQGTNMGLPLCWDGTYSSLDSLNFEVQMRCKGNAYCS